MPLGDLDDEARAELLCYLVAGQLVAKARTGAWLSPRHIVELMEIWMLGNGAGEEWTEEFEFGLNSVEIAKDFLGVPDFAEPTMLAQLFTDGWRLDYRSPAVQDMYETCRTIARIA